MTSVWSEILGDILLTKSGNEESAALLSSKTVLLYFSGHWCGPCRGFTPELAKFYADLKAKGNINFEIVFISSDRDEAAFNSYYQEMPWLALPFSNREKKSELSKTYKVRGIPSLVVLNSDGSLITTSGREMVSSDPTAMNFPWIPKPFFEELDGSFLTKSEGSVVSLSEPQFSGKYLGLYFSAHWCPPCKSFTPILAQFYINRKKQLKDDFEIIFCSSDQGKPEFDDYYSEMPWMAIPFEDPRINALSSRFEISGIPALIIIDSQGKVVTTNARSGVMSDPEGMKFPYHPEPVEDLSCGIESYGCEINDTPSLIIFAENCDDSAQIEALNSVMPYADKMAKQKVAADSAPEMIFFKAFVTSDMGDRIRELTKIGKASASEGVMCLILDLADEGSYYKKDFTTEDVNEQTIGEFINGFKLKNLEKCTLK